MHIENYDLSQRITRTLYLETDSTIADIADLTDTDETTIDSWISEFGWDKIRTSLLSSRKSQLQLLYKCLRTLQDKAGPGKELEPKDVDLYLKYTAAIKNLQEELSVATNVEVFAPFICWLRRYEHQMSQSITPLIDAFLKEKAAEK